VRAGPASERGEDCLEILHRCPGRVQRVEADGTLYLSRNYTIYRSRDGGKTWTGVASLPLSTFRRTVEHSRLACRLLRHEVRALARLTDGTLAAASREGVFYGREGEGELKASTVAATGARPRPPMRLTVGPGDVVLWGEYTSARPARSIRLYASRDGARSFRVIHTFEDGSVLHVHNLIWDPHLGHYWVLVGDHDDEPGIGCLSADLERFEWFVKGEQRFRAVSVFDFGDHLLYATDTEREQNALVRLDKLTGRTERLREFDGSCIYACRFGEIYALTTTVEPGVNASPWAELWLSRDAKSWTRAFRARKDRWHPDYFQFGSLVLPTGETPDDTVFFSGQAVRGLDGEAVVARVRERTLP